MEPNHLIDRELVRALLAAQFPDWAHLHIEPVLPGGWDNRTFRIGDRLMARLPSSAAYATQVDKEQHWLPRLAPLLPLDIPVPMGQGLPTADYPWHWSVRGWIDGETASRVGLADSRSFALDLGRFLAALQGADAAGGPPAGAHSFHRGGSLHVYDAEVREAVSILRDRIDVQAVIDLWDCALATSWSRKAVWVHGDISPGNLLARDGKLCAVIDFGQLCVGDPACDLAIAWTFMKPDGRKVFRKTLPLDDDAWLRGRAWALWKALIVASGLTQTNAVEYADPWRVITEVLRDST